MTELVFNILWLVMLVVWVGILTLLIDYLGQIRGWWDDK